MCDDLKEGEKRCVPNPVCKFEDVFEDYPDIMANIRKTGFQKPTPIQVLVQNSGTCSILMMLTEP